jgi:hypothetical protein
VNQSSIDANDTSPVYNDPILFNITVWNIGDKAAPQVNVSCYYNGIFFDSDVINTIPPDTSMQTPRYATCEWTALVGTYNISIKVDPDNSITEYNETNNEAWAIISVDKASQTVYLQLNGTSGDRTYLLNIDQIAEIRAWSSISILPVTIYANYTGDLQSIGYASSGVATNYTTISAVGIGKYLIRANSTGNANYSSATSDSYIMTVREPVVTLTCEAGGPYTTTSSIIIVGSSRDIEGTPVFSSGYIEATKASILQDNKTFSSSLEGKFSSIFGPFTTGNYLINVSANESYCTDSFSIIYSTASCGLKNITLSGKAYNSATGEEIPIGTVRVTILETGDETEKSFTNGEWSVIFSSCFDSGKRYNAAVKITDEAGKASYSQTQFIAP